MIVLPHQLHDNKFKIECQPPNPLLGYPGFEDLQDVMERLFVGKW